MKQGALTAIVGITPGREAALRELLDGIGDAVEDSTLVPFPAMTTLHFGRWVVLPEQPSVVDGTVFPAQLVLSTSYDGSLRDHLDEFIRVAGRGLDAIYGHCLGYPDAASRTPATTRAYLEDHAVDHAIFYVGAPGLSVTRIRQEGQLRERIEAFLDERGAAGEWTASTAAAVRQAVRGFVGGEADLRWALNSPAPPEPSLPWYGWVGLAVAAILALPLLLSGALLVRCAEWLDDHRPPPAEPQAPAPPLRQQVGRDREIRTVTRREDVQVQNELSHVVEIKPGWIRRAALRAVLPLVNFVGRHIYNQGSLFGVSTLHFVRWVLIDGGRRLMFLTNYDGSMISYVGDFVNKSWQIPSALTAIWSNTVGFPRTRWLVLDGARDIRRFTAFLRDHQVATGTWYSAYKRLTTGNVVNNAGIRRGLVTALTEAETVEWARRL